MNLYQRHGARVNMATLADFNGNRWTSNALIHQVPGGASYLLPAGVVMRLFKRHNGKQGITVKSGPSNLDIAGSRVGNKIFLHVANMDYSRSIETSFAIDSMRVATGRVIEIAPENPRQAITENNPEVFKPKEHSLTAAVGSRWRFPARSVSAVELDCVAV